MMSELIFMCIGIFLGWVVIPQPDWAQTLYDWMKVQAVKFWRKYIREEKTDEDKSSES